MITMSPSEYMNWLIGVQNVREVDAIDRVTKLYLQQTGMRIKLFLTPFKGDLVWDYSYED